MCKKALLLIVLLCVCQSLSASALRCNSRLAKDGDSAFKFRQVCGEPDDIQTTVVYRRQAIRSLLGVDRKNNVVLSDEQTVAITVEKWIYNFGPNRFMRQVTFENGKAVSIEKLGRGF